MFTRKSVADKDHSTFEPRNTLTTSYWVTHLELDGLAYFRRLGRWNDAGHADTVSPLTHPSNTRRSRYRQRALYEDVEPRVAERGIGFE